MSAYDRDVRHLAVLVAALVLAPTAGAWTTLGSANGNTTVPSLLVTQAGTLLAAFDAPGGGVVVSRAGAAPQTVVGGDPVSDRRPQLVQQPDGALQLYFPNAQGVGRMTSTDDGRTWTGPIQTQSHTTGPVNAAAVAPDGTPYFAQDGTGFVNVFRGLNGEQVTNVYTRCCGYFESLAVDTAGLVEVAFYSNADANAATVLQTLGGVPPTVLKPVAQHEAPLVADHSGATFLAWAPGYPTAQTMSVVPFRGGTPSGDGVSFHGPFSGPEPHLALAVDRDDRLWVVWTQGGKLRAARSRSHGLHFGATVTVPEPGSVYQLAAAGISGGAGHASVVVNTGTALATQDVQPGLSVRMFRTTAKKKGRKVVTWWAQALDDGFGVPHPSFRVSARTVVGDATGKAKVPHGRGTARAAGYVSASFRVP
jgi:hypothetical protein